MARAKVIHSQDACTIQFNGNPKDPEPTTGLIKFPGGYVEVTRTSDGSYWAHLALNEGDDGSVAGKVINSRVEYVYPYGNKNGIPQVPDAEHVSHLSLRISRHD